LIEVTMVDHDFLEAHNVFPAALQSGNSVLYLRALLENSPIATLVLDAQHRYTMCNPAFEKLFQYTPEQLSTEDIDTLIAPDRSHEATQITQSVLRGVKVHTLAQRRRRDGALLDVEIHGIPLIVDGELAGVYGLYQDVTEQNHAREAFRSIADRLESLQQEERRKLARDLHDSTSQELAALNWNLTRLLRLVSSEQENDLNKLVRETQDIARQCSDRIRSASYLLHPPALGKGGLASAVPWMVEGFEQRSGIRVHLEMSADLGRFRSGVEVTLYHVLQEGLANVLRHSGSQRVTISLLRKENWLELVIKDRGTNTSETSASRPGIGIKSMRERIDQLRGFFSIDIGRKGTTLVATVPVGA
jgi:two-component system NarL family sensor kinase